MSGRLDFVLMSDANYVWPLTAAIAGIVCACRRQSCFVHVIDCGIDDQSWSGLVRRLGDVAQRQNAKLQIDRLHPDLELLSRLPSYRGTVATYARLLTPQLLPNVDVCVYVDCDVLLVDDISDVCRLFAASGLLVGGHQDIAPTRTIETRFLTCNGLPVAEDEYLCCGLLFMNLRGLRACAFTERAFAFLAAHPDVPFADQSAINCLCRGAKFRVDDGWGLMAGECYGTVPVHAVHFAGVCPWVRIPSWYEFIAFSRVHDLWYVFCERAFGRRALRRAYHPWTDDVWQGLVARFLGGLSTLLCSTGLASRRWRSLNGYVKSCQDVRALRAAFGRLAENVNRGDE